MYVQSVEKEEATQVPSQLAFNHDGTRVVVSFGRRLSLYSSLDGKLIKRLKGHKDDIYSVSYSHDGKRIASGGADKTTIIWNEEGKGILKFTHSDSVQIVAYNPVEDILASCSSSDFGFWSQNDNSVLKHKVDAKVTCASWRNDGQVIAIGLFSGKISMYNIYGIEIGTIERNAPVLSINWNRKLPNNKNNDLNCLVVGCWDMTLSFYDEFCQQLNEEQFLECYPSCVTFFGQSNEYVIIATSSGNVHLHHRNGSFLKSLCHDHDGWIWCVQNLHSQHSIVCINATGELSCYQIVDSIAVHDRLNNHLAYCKGGTDVTVVDCSNSLEMRQITCTGMVEKLDLLDDQLAVVEKNKLLLYEMSSHGSDNVNQQCSLEMMDPIDNIILTSDHIIVNLKKKVVAFDKAGKQKREWYLPECVTCFQQFCVIQGEERILVGGEEGTIAVLSIDSAFFSPLVKVEGSISSISVSHNNRYIGIICDDSQLKIYDQTQKTFVVERRGPYGFLFHNVIETLYCYNYKGIVTIADITQRDFSLEEEDSHGTLISFVGLKIYLQRDNSFLHQIDTCLLPLAHRNIKDNDFDKAFNVALLGCPNNFLHYLAEQSLMNSNFNVAMKCYRCLNLPNMIDYVQIKKLNSPQDGLLTDKAKACISAEIAVINGEYVRAEEIAKNYNDATHSLVEMFVKLRMFAEAKNLMKNVEPKLVDAVSLKEAKWREQIKEWEKACSLYCDCGHYEKGVDIIGERQIDGWIDIIVKLSNEIPSTEVKALRKCCEYMSDQEGINDIVEGILLKIKDYSSLMSLYLKNKQWIEIRRLCKDHINDIDKALMMPYAHWLAIQGQLDNAIDIYNRIGQHAKTIDFLHSLIENLILEENFKRVALLHRILSEEYQLLVRVGALPEQIICSSFLLMYTPIYFYLAIA